MKKIYLILPLLVILFFIILSAMKVINTPDNEQRIKEQTDDVLTDLTEKVVLPSPEDIVMPIDMKKFMIKTGVPVPHGSVFDNNNTLEKNNSSNEI